MPPTVTGRGTPLLISLVRALAVLGALCAIGFPVWLWSDADRVKALSSELVGLPPGAVSVGPDTLWQGLLTSLPASAVLVFSLWQLWCLFGEYGRGRALERPALARLRRFAWGLLGLTALRPVTGAALSAVLTLHNPPGQRLLRLSLGSDDYLALLLAAVLLAIAQVMHQAVELAEENRGFV
jgi:hypothetical protein